MVHGSSFFDFGEGENRLPDRTLAARGLEENGDQIDYDIMRRYHTITWVWVRIAGSRQ